MIHWFTPTPVGTTARRWMCLSQSTVHPHACGDNDGTLVPCFNHNGSPPRLWGQRLHLHVLDWEWRFTPTPVGTTLASTRTRLGVAVHPHACGDNSGLRGAVVGRSAVHPHACGDNSDFSMAALLPTGSPPRLWGQRWGRGRLENGSAVQPHACGDNALVRFCATRQIRFTPTPVGTTRKQSFNGI